MFKGDLICKICGGKIDYNLKTKPKETGDGNLVILERNDNGSFKCRITVKCYECNLYNETIEDIFIDNYCELI